MQCEQREQRLPSDLIFGIPDDGKFEVKDCAHDLR